MINKNDKQLIKLLQSSISISTAPFKEIAEKLDLSEKEILDKINQWKQDGLMRRFGAVVNHQAIGCKENALSVWEVPDSKIADFKQAVLNIPEISHCYIRQTYPEKNWNYNIYAMIHCKTRHDCEKIAIDLSNLFDIKNYKLIYSEKEYKKKSPQYY